MKHSSKLAIGALLFALLLVGTLASAASVTLSASGTSQYLMSAIGLQNVHTMDATITFDTTTLANPQVSSGNLTGNVLMAGNEVAPGSYKVDFASIAPINGTGTLVVLSFSQLTAAPGRVTGFDINLGDDKGVTVPVTHSFVNAVEQGGGDSSSQSGAQGGGGTDGSSSGQKGGITNIVSVTLPPDGTVQPEKVKEVPLTAPVKEEPLSVAASVPRDTSASQSGKGGAPPPPANKGNSFTVRTSVLELFKEFQGEKTSQALMSLFNQSGDTAFRQEPPVALSDGTSTIRIKMDPGASGQAPPTFALKGASLISLTQGDKSGWLIEARPKKGVIKASVTVLNNETMTEYPLTVAPPADIDLAKKGSVTEEDFALFLKDSPPPPPPAIVAAPAAPIQAPVPAAGTFAPPLHMSPFGRPVKPQAPVAPVAAPVVPKAAVNPPQIPVFKNITGAAALRTTHYDLNGDGKHDYIDDYIFTANYLARLAAETKAPAKDLK